MKIFKKYSAKFGTALLLGLVVIMFLMSGPSILVFAKDRYSDLQLFAKVLNLIQQYYVEEVDTKKLITGGIKGMLNELDPHTMYMPPEVFKEFKSETSGEFGGLGVEITLQKGILTVISPIEDAPAFVAGIKAGDKIVAINGESTKGLSLAEAAQRMKGSKGTKIILSVFRDGFEKPKDITVVRGTVKIKSVKYTDFEEGYAYIKITSFLENTYKDFKKYVDQHTKKYKSVKGLILDLRKNPGGLLDQAVSMSDYFLDKGVIVSTMDRNKKEKKTIYAKSDNNTPNYPLVILVDEYSASASEIVAGALQDGKRALIMGQKTFGKGSVQSVVELGDGSGLKLTVSRYYTPSGRSIQAEGIMPDVVVDQLSAEVLDKAMQNTQVRREKDISRHLENDNGEFDGLETPPHKQATKKNTKNNGGKEGMMQMWWSESDNTTKILTPKEKLLKEDFQILQAFNYLRAWGVITNFSTMTATPDNQDTK